MKRVRVGLIGCGGIGNLHLGNLLAREDVEIVGLSDSFEKSLELAGQRAGQARLYCNYRDMLVTEAPDAVFVAVPPFNHGEIETLAAERGIHMYVEKPVGLSLERARETEAKIRASGVISSVGFHQRYCPAVETMKERIRGAEVGVANAWWTMNMPRTPWWRQRKMSGGQVIEQTIHLFDMFRYFFGEAATVYASPVTGIVRNVENYEIDDASSAVITFRSGVVATVTSCCYMEEFQGYTPIDIRVVCRDRVLEYDWDNELREFTKSGMERTPVPEDAHKTAAMAFIDAVKAGDPSMIRSDYADGVRTLELVLAVEQSMRLNNVIRIDG